MRTLLLTVAAVMAAVPAYADQRWSNSAVNELDDCNPATVRQVIASGGSCVIRGDFFVLRGEPIHLAGVGPSCSSGRESKAKRVTADYLVGDGPVAVERVGQTNSGETIARITVTGTGMDLTDMLVRRGLVLPAGETCQ